MPTIELGLIWNITNYVPYYSERISDRGIRNLIPYINQIIPRGEPRSSTSSPLYLRGEDVERTGQWGEIKKIRYLVSLPKQSWRNLSGQKKKASL